MIKHMIIQVSHKSIKYLKQANNKVQPPKKQERIKEQHSLSKPMIYTFSPSLATSYQKIHKNAQCQIDSQAWSSSGGVYKTPRMKASIDVDGAGGVGAGAGGTEAVAGADEVALVSVTSTAADLCPLGTQAKALVVDLPFFSYTSS